MFHAAQVIFKEIFELLKLLVLGEKLLSEVAGVAMLSEDKPLDSNASIV